MLFVLNPDLIENDLFTMYAHRELDLNCNAEIESQNTLWSTGYQALIIEICIMKGQKRQISSKSIIIAASKAGIFERRARVDHAKGLYYRKEPLEWRA